MSILTLDNNNFYLDGSRFNIIAGDIHYFRIPKSKWEHTLDLAVDFGLNTIQTYVPWNAHEPQKGVFDFSGMLDLAGYLELCNQKGLKVLLRPAPYICSEWDLGGLPAWLLRDRDMVLRSSDTQYLTAVREYYNHLIPVFLPYLSTNGGPIIAVSIENEYGSYCNDHTYVSEISETLKLGGVDVPLYTTDADTAFCQTFGMGKNVDFFGVNYRAKPGTSAHAEMVSKKLGPDQPFFIGEFWAGRSMHWGEPFFHRDPTETADAFREALKLGGNVCFYMFAGGTNFGFMGGANISKSYSPRPNTPERYIPHTTSYDVDALISEGGEPSLKYFLCRDVLDEFLGKPKRPHVYKKQEHQSLSVTLSETADLFQNLDVLTKNVAFSIAPKPMEHYGQSYGLILYSTVLDAFEDSPMIIEPYKYRDRANIYIDDKWCATFLRDRGVTRKAEQRSTPTITPNGSEQKIDILVENIGRVNYGRHLPYERKGLEDCILCGNSKLCGYSTRTLPLNDLSRLAWSKNSYTEHKPCFFKGRFKAAAGVDTFVNFENFDHGYIWINGFNLGRYDSAGPQMTLYVPGELLRDDNNEIIVLDINPIGEKNCISLSSRETLEGEATELS